MPIAPRGLYRFRGDWVQVQYETEVRPLGRSEYISFGYEPPYQSLPDQAQYEAVQSETTHDLNLLVSADLSRI